MSCPDCFVGVLSKETSTGTVEKVHGFNCYVARPSGQPKGAVLILPDVFGWELVNTRVLADAIANEGGYIVYLPDFMNGKAPGYSSMLVMDRLKEPQTLWDKIFMRPINFIRVVFGMIKFFITVDIPGINKEAMTFCNGIRSAPETSALKIGAAAYCFGAPTMAHLASDPEGENLVDAVFTAHPSLVKPKNFEGVKKPVSIIVGDKDRNMTLSRLKVIEDLLKKKEEVPSQVVVVPGANHGFGVRGDWKDPVQKAAGQGALKQMLDWFAQHFNN